PLRGHADVPLLGRLLPGRTAAAPVSRDRVCDPALERRRSDAALDARHADARAVHLACRLSRRLGLCGASRRATDVSAEARDVTAFAAGRTRGHLLFERNLMVYRRAWLTIVSGFFEPIFYLFSLGLGLGHYVGPVQGVSYAAYIAPALLASSAMNGAVYDGMTNVFWKLRYGKVYD